MNKYINESKLLRDIENIDNYINNNEIRIKKYNKGSIIHHESEVCRMVDIVLDGFLRAYNLSENGNETIMFDFNIGSIVGSNLLISDNKVYPFNIFCEKDSIVAHITQSALEELLHDYNFVLKFIESLSKNSIVMNKKIKMYSHKTLRMNLMDYFNHQIKLQNTVEIVLPIKKKDLADYLGVQRQSLFRELKKMKDDKLIKVNGNKIKIL